MSATGTGSKRKRVNIVKITIDGVEVDAKECTKCGEVKALTEYNANGLGGTRPDCRECHNESKRKHHKSNPEKNRERSRNWNKSNPEYHRNWCKNNQERDRERKRKWFRDNHEKVRYIQQNYYMSNPERFRENARKWRENNPTHNRVKCSYRRTRKRALPSNWTVKHESLLLTRFNGNCAITFYSKDTHVDHVIPLAWGHGGSYIGNMIPLSSTLNISKNNRHFYEWFEANRQRFKLDQSRFDAVVADLANQNGLTPDEYRAYVDWCFDNKRSLDDIIADNKRYGYVVTSVELWREATGMQFPLRFINNEQTYTSEISA